MDQHQIDIDYLAILRRRIHWLIWPALIFLVGAAVISVLLPNVYKSEASILIEDREISEGLVPSTVTTYADQRIEVIKHEVMSRSNILGLVEKFDLYPELKEKISTNALVTKVKDSISVQPKSAAIKTGRDRPGYVTVAFTISCESKEPRKAQQVVSDLTSFFLAKNLKARQASAKGTTEFLEKQVEIVKEDLAEMDKKISVFKEVHLEELPEFMGLNMQKIDKIEQKINNIDQQLLSLQEQAIGVKYKLGFLDPYSTDGHRVLSDAERLQQLQLKLLEFKSKYSPEHPRVQALSKEIESLRKTVDEGPGLAQKRKRLQELQQSLAEDLSKYSEEHPVVKRVTSEIENLKKEIEEAEINITAEPGEMHHVDLRNVTNPAYINLQSELDRIQLRRTTFEEQKKELMAEEAQIYAKLRTMPDIETQYQELNSERQNLRRNLSGLQSKLQVAQVAEGMEEGQLGERFTVTEPAYLPDHPYKPNRIAIMALGLVLGLAASLGFAALREYTDRSVRMPEEIQRLTGYSVLSTIPKIQTPNERKKKIIKWATIPSLSLVVLASGVAVFHYYVMDLYIFYDKVWKIVSDRLFVHF